MKTALIENNRALPLADIPTVPYGRFSKEVLALLSKPENHCVAYFGLPEEKKLRLICAIADDRQGRIALLAHQLNRRAPGTLTALTAENPALHVFERELHETYGIPFENHPWLKPLRFSHDRANPELDLGDYPFYSIGGDELHEVGVGPIHAGVIEPGHFRFLCHGEKVLHLEIQLGYQHRGVEKLFLQKKNLLQRTVLAESIAGDTAVGHAVAFAGVMESLCGFTPPAAVNWARTLSLELERVAIHTGDLGAMCTDVAYQFGAAMLGALRTPIINFTQQWCGNRFGKGLVRVGYNPHPFTAELRRQLTPVLTDFEKRVQKICGKMLSLPSLLHRFDKTGVVTRAQVERIGAVGMAARMAALPRDIRASHPHLYYREIPYQPVVEECGDVLSRARLRSREIGSSLAYIHRLLNDFPSVGADAPAAPPQGLVIAPDHLAINLVEGWRGEICHVAVSGAQGELRHYKVYDPSVHNWLALALAVRNNEISDFPICNKSFNLSYCGHDL